MEKMTQYAVPGILALLILKEVFGYLRKSNGSDRKPCEGCYFRETHSEKKLRAMGDQIDELHAWHRPDPETGKFKWYSRDGEIIDAIRDMDKDIVRELREFRKVWKNGK